MEKAVSLSLGALGWLSSHPKSKAKHLAGGEWRWLTHVWMSYGGEQEWRSGSTNTAICFGLEQISAAFWGTISQHFQYVGRTMWSSVAKSAGARKTASGSRGDESKQLAQDIQDPSFQKTAQESWNKEDSTPSSTSSFLYRQYKAAPQGAHCANYQERGNKLLYNIIKHTLAQCYSNLTGNVKMRQLSVCARLTFQLNVNSIPRFLSDNLPIKENDFIIYSPMSF